MINFCANEAKNGVAVASIPRCPAANCVGEYWYSIVRRALNEETEKMYETICARCVELFDDASNAENQYRRSKARMFAQLRAEKLDAIRFFPPAIAKTIAISLQSKLKTITKENRMKIDRMFATIRHKKCTMTLCNGTMNEMNNHFECNTCGTLICSECEELMEKTVAAASGGGGGGGEVQAETTTSGPIIQHQCKPENVESVQMIRTLVQCPSCKIPAVKSYGCNNITCPVCKVNFHYLTGERIDQGNHDNVTIVLKQTPDLKALPYMDIEFVKLLDVIKAGKPRVVVGYGSHTNTNTSKSSGTITSAKQYERKAKNKILCKAYAGCLETLFEHHEKNTLSLTVLEIIVRKVESLRRVFIASN
jgi:hypothetical protein